MSQTKRLSIVLFLNIIMIAGLFIVGVASHSLGVLAAGGDFIADSLGLALGLFAVHRRDIHGNSQATTYVALVNASVLFVVVTIVTTQAFSRLYSSHPDVQGLPILVISVISALVMGVGVIVLGKGAGKEDLHMRSVLLDTVSDGLSATAVAVVGAIIIYKHSFRWLDSVVAILISIYIGYGAIKLLIDVVHALKTGFSFSTRK